MIRSPIHRCTGAYIAAAGMSSSFVLLQRVETCRLSERRNVLLVPALAGSKAIQPPS